MKIKVGDIKKIIKEEILIKERNSTLEHIKSLNEIRPLEPQSDDRIEWENEVCYNLSNEIGCDNSDAQGIMMIHGDLLDKCYSDGISPEITAKLVSDKD